ncbi:MAG: SRPBCC family protein [Dehalococcoidia bacterium]
MQFEYSIDINAAPERVWGVMTDVERWPEWTASMSEVRLVEGDRLAVGARARVRQPKLSASTLEVTELEPGRGFTWQAASPGVSFVGKHEIAPARAGVTVTLSVQFSGPLAGIAGLFTSGMTRRYVKMEAEGLKRRSEGAG